jgi:outer membrane protein assembly factor BamE (lipoprotein component of BamABCDE complex)
MQSIVAASRGSLSSITAPSRRERRARVDWLARLDWLSRIRLAAVAVAATSLAGCLGYDGEIAHGFQADQQALADVKPGESAEQVLVVLGTPSTTSTVGGSAWYYISQKTNHDLAFLPKHLTDQHIYAVYFDKSKKVTRIANYGMQDGKVVDFSSRTTQTSGTESTFLKNMMLNLMHFGGSGGSAAPGGPPS